MKHTRQAWHTQITQNLYSAFRFWKLRFRLLSLFLAFSLLKTDQLNSKHVKNLRFVPARRRFDVDRRFQRSRRKNKILHAPKTPKETRTSFVWKTVTKNPTCKRRIHSLLHCNVAITRYNWEKLLRCKTQRKNKRYKLWLAWKSQLLCYGV